MGRGTRVAGEDPAEGRESPRERGARAHTGAPTLYAHRAPRSQQSRRESLPGAQAPTGPSQGLTMAFGLRALSGPDCRHCWCQPPGRCHPGVHPHPAPCSLAGIASSAAQTGSQEALHPDSWPPDLPHTSCPFPSSQGSCLPFVLSIGFTGHSQWVWPCQGPPAPPLASQQSHLER